MAVKASRDEVEKDHFQILTCERQLADPEFRRSSEKLAELLDDDFIEFGASGRVFDKSQTLSSLATEPSFPGYEIKNFTVRRLTDGTCLATYRIPPRTDANQINRPGSIRSSIWQQVNGRWRLLFHQGTRIPGEI